MELITFILTSFGITYIIVYGGIFKKMREYLEENYPFFGDLVGCPMCFGFWSAFMVYELDQYGYEIINYCFIGSFFSYLAYLCMRPLMDKYD